MRRGICREQKNCQREGVAFGVPFIIRINCLSLKKVVLSYFS